MALIIKPGRDPAENWIKAINGKISDLEIRVWPDCGNLEDIEFALVSHIPHGELARFPNLRFVASTAAGVDELLADPDLSHDVPIIHGVNSERSDTMAQTVLLHVLRYHRHLQVYGEQQSRHEWKRYPLVPADERRVGIMGLGALGSVAAARLVQSGFDVAGWTRRPKTIDGVTNFHGADGLGPFLGRTGILVCMLPLTAETEDVINANTLAALPKGAFVINCARGAHLVDEDLIAALDSGHIAGATLDVFRTEPLAPDHPFWDHPRITITPHTSSQGRAAFGVDVLVENMRRARAGEPLVNLVDREAGY
ncbi:MAG: glyoxylate/hydroxypyruvate reductase A [Alphaproteobacteria bacterium]